MSKLKATQATTIALVLFLMKYASAQSADAPLCAPRGGQLCSVAESARYWRYQSAFAQAEKSVPLDLSRSIALYKKARKYALGDQCAVAQLDDRISAAKAVNKMHPHATGYVAETLLNREFQKRWLKNKCDRR